MTPSGDHPDTSLADQVRGNWQALKRLRPEHPSAVNWGPARPQTPRLLGLHPDFRNPKRRRRPKPKADKPEHDRD